MSSPEPPRAGTQPGRPVRASGLPVLRARRQGATPKHSVGNWLRRKQVVAGALLAAVGVALVVRVRASADNAAVEAGRPGVDISATDASASIPTGDAATQTATAAAAQASAITRLDATVQPQGQTEALATAQSDIEATSRAEAEATPQIEVQATSRPEAEATAQAEIEATSRPEAEATPQIEVQAATRPDASPQAEVEVTTSPETESTADPEAHAEPTLGTTGRSAPVPPPRSRTTQQQAGYRTYTVQRGDILKQIAARYGVSMASILAINTIPNPDSLRIGQVLTIPPPGS